MLPEIKKGYEWGGINSKKVLTSSFELIGLQVVLTVVVYDLRPLWIPLGFWFKFGILRGVS